MRLLSAYALLLIVLCSIYMHNMLSLNHLLQSHKYIGGMINACMLLRMKNTSEE